MKNKSHDWSSLPLSNKFQYFVSFWPNTNLVLRRKGIALRALMWAVTSLWPQKVVCRSQIYSARAKLKLISDQATDLFEGRPLCVPFKTARLHPGS